MSNATPRPPSSPAARLVFGAFVVLATAFVGSTIAQVVPVVFGEKGAADGTGGARLSPECDAGIATLRDGVVLALGRASQESDRRAARTVYDLVKEEKWRALPDVERWCAGDSHGPEAVGALVRFERAASSSATKNAERVGQVHREVDSYIRSGTR